MDDAVAAYPAIERLLRQGRDEVADRTAAVAQLRAVAR